MSRTRLGAAWREALRDGGELGNGLLDLASEAVGDEQDARQQARDDAGGAGLTPAFD